MINLILVLVEFNNNLLLIIPLLLLTKIRVRNKTKIKCKLCLVVQEIKIKELKMLDFILKHLNRLRSMVTQRIKTDNSDRIWKTLVAIQIKLLETKPVAFLEYLMDMVANRFQNIAQRLFQLSLEKKYKRNHTIYMQFMKVYFKKLIANWS